MSGQENPFSEPAPAAAGAGEGEPAQKSCMDVKAWSDNQAQRTLRMSNIMNGLLMITAAVIIFFVGTLKVGFTEIVVSAYSVFFGLMITCVELNISNIQPQIRAGFGFMFTVTGRSIFIFFTATVCLSLGYWLGYIVAALTMLNAFFNMYVFCMHPAYQPGGQFYGSPDEKKTTAESEIAGYLQRNPQVAQRAGQAAMQAAKDNPDLARQAATGAAGAR